MSRVIVMNFICLSECLRVKGGTIYLLRIIDKSRLCMTEDILEIGGRDFSGTNVLWGRKKTPGQNRNEEFFQKTIARTLQGP